jgi:hypothetical protein
VTRTPRATASTSIRWIQVIPPRSIKPTPPTYCERARGVNASSPEFQGNTTNDKQMHVSRAANLDSVSTESTHASRGCAARSNDCAFMRLDLNCDD